MKPCLFAAALLLAAAPLFADLATAPTSAPAAGIRIPKTHLEPPFTSNGDGTPVPTYYVSVFSEQSAHPITNTDASPSATIAWMSEMSDEIYLVLRVSDSTPAESNNDSSLSDGDSVELTLSDPANPKQSFQLVIAPGFDTAHDRHPRTVLNDNRANKSSPPTLTVTAHSRTWGSGYEIYAHIPTANLNLPAALGSRLNLQIVVNDTIAAGQKIRYRWRSADVAPFGPPEAQSLVLANTASDPFTLAVSADYQSFRRLRLRVNSSVAAAQRLSVADDSGKELAALAYAGGRGNLDLPFPADKPYGKLTLLRDGTPVTTFLPDKPPTRQSALEQLKLRLSAFAFAGERFPGVELEDPLAAEDSNPGLAATVRYFDSALNEVTAAKKPGRYAAVVHLAAAGAADDRLFTLYRYPDQPINWREVELSLKDVKLPPQFGIAETVTARQDQFFGEYVRDLLREDLRRTHDVAVVLAGLAETPPDAAPFVARTSPWSRNSSYQHALKKKLGLFKPYRYLEHLPPGYADEKNHTQKYPLIVFLHGAGERGDDLNSVKKNGLPVYLANHPDFPAIVLMPQCPRNGWWQPEALAELLDAAIAKYRVDEDRVIFTGLSMGGFGSWNFATWYPERLAAIAPVCGIGDPRDMARLKNIPAWVFHGDADATVPIAPDRACVDALKAAGGSVQFTVYPGVGHDSWTRAYDTPELYPWLLAQKRAAK